MVTKGGAAALAGAIGTGSGLAAGVFFGPAILGMFGAGPNAPSPFDSFASGVSVVNAAAPAGPLLGPTRVYNFSGPYDTSTGQGSVQVSVYAFFYANGVLAAILNLQSQSFGGSTSYIAYFINSTGSSETISGITGLVTAAAASVNSFTYTPS